MRVTLKHVLSCLYITISFYCFCFTPRMPWQISYRPRLLLLLTLRGVVVCWWIISFPVLSEIKPSVSVFVWFPSTQFRVWYTVWTVSPGERNSMLFPLSLCWKAVRCCLSKETTVALELDERIERQLRRDRTLWRRTLKLLLLGKHLGMGVGSLLD